MSVNILQKWENEREQPFLVLGVEGRGWHTLRNSESIKAMAMTS